MAKEPDAHAEVYIAARGGLVGVAIVRPFAAVGFSNVLTSPCLRLDAVRVHALAGA